MDDNGESNSARITTKQFYVELIALKDAQHEREEKLREYLDDKFAQLNEMLEKRYVTKEQHTSSLKALAEKIAPLQKVVYGAVGVILLGVLTTILALALRKP